MATKSSQPATYSPEDLLELPSYSPVNTSHLRHDAYSADGDYENVVQGIAENTQAHIALIEAQHEKTVTSQRLTGHMHQVSADVFNETINHHEALYEKEQGGYLQRYRDAFLVVDAKLTSRHLYGLSEIGAHTMASVVAQSTLPDKRQAASQPKKLTLTQRITGVYP